MSTLYVNGYWHNAIDDYLKKGKPFREWVIKEYARQYGALIELRDSPTGIEIPVFEVSKYHLEEGQKTEKDLAKLLKFTEKQKVSYGQKRINEGIKHAQKQIAERQKELSLLRKWTANVESFHQKARNIPGMEHIGKNLKEQYDEIFTESSTNYYEKELKRYEKLDPMKYWQDAVESAREDIVYHAKKYQEDVERTTKRNLWVKSLKELLQSI